MNKTIDMEHVRIGQIMVSPGEGGRINCEIPTSWNGDAYLKWKDQYSNELKALKLKWKKGKN